MLEMNGSCESCCTVSILSQGFCRSSESEGLTQWTIQMDGVTSLFSIKNSAPATGPYRNDVQLEAHLWFY